MNDLVYTILGYLCGSIPFGLILTRAAGLGDVRTIGSGNIGATNVLRTGNKKVAAATLLLDAAKGFFPVWIASTFGSEWAAIGAGFGAMIGHIFPVWLKFKGGKGVATGLGVLLAWAWPIALLGLVVWIGTFLISRISSLSALVASASMPILGFLFFQNETYRSFLWPIAALALIIWLTHHQNIGRLLKGEEGQSKFSKKT